MAFQSKGAKGFAERTRAAIENEARQMKLGDAPVKAGSEGQPVQQDGRLIRVTQGHIDLSRRAHSPCSATHNPIALAIVTELQRPDLYVSTWPDARVKIGNHCYPLPSSAEAADKVWCRCMEMEPFEFWLSRERVAC